MKTNETGKRLKVYISGKVTGDKNAKINFTKAWQKLQIMSFDVVNPVREVENLVSETKCNKKREPTYKEYIDYTLKLLMECDAIYMLQNWTDSKGASLEYNYAKICGLKDITNEVDQTTIGF